MEFPEIVPDDTGNKKPWEETDEESALSEFLRLKLEREEGAVPIMEAPPSPVGTPVDDSSDSDSNIETDDSSRVAEEEADETGRPKLALLLKLFAAFIGVATVFICLHLFAHRGIEWQITFAVLGPAVVVSGLVLVWKAVRFFRSKIPVAYDFLRPRLSSGMSWGRLQTNKAYTSLSTSLRRMVPKNNGKVWIAIKVILVILILTIFGGTLLGIVIHIALPAGESSSDSLWSDTLYYVKIGILGLTTLSLLAILLVKGWYKTTAAILAAATLSIVLVQNQGWFAGVPWEYWPWVVGALLAGSLLILIFWTLGHNGVKNWSLALGALIIVLLGIAIGSVYLFNAMEGYTESKRPKDQLTQNAPSDPKPSRSISVTAPVGKFGPRVANTGKLMWVEPENDVEVRYTGYANIGGRSEESWTYKKGPNFNPTPKEVYPDKYREKGVIVYWVEVKSLVSVPAKVEVKFD